jgi:GT2 family glycosyltransferase/glycosyltransferase involved in cell wall biosynthesis
VDLVHFHHTYLSSISLLEVALDAGLPVVLTLHDAWHLCPRLHCINDQGFCGGPEDLARCTTCLSPYLQEPTPETRQKLGHILTTRRNYVKNLFPRLNLLAPSRFLRNLHYQCGVAPGRIIHLPLGLDDLGPPLQVQPENPPRFVFLGNIIPVKRLDLALEAFASLAGQAVLDIWGGLPQPQPGTLLDSLAAHHHINYRGPYRRTDLPKILAGAAAVVMCSDFENYPLVAREALMLGVPVIASRAGGLPEIVRHGQNGLLFPPGDAGALRRQVTRVIRQPALLNRLRQGIAPVKTMVAEAAELLEFYRSLLLIPPRHLRPAEIREVPASPPRRTLASIIIPTCNNLDLTRQCLESIRACTEPGDYEIIAVDNGSSDGTPDYLREQEAAGHLTAILNPENLGFARASNQGARAAAGQYLVFLNNDTVATPGWLGALCRCAGEDERIAAVGAKLLYPDDSVQHAGAVFNANKKIYHIYKSLHKDHPAVNKKRAFQVLTAACLLVKREVFQAVGSFDEQYRNGYEDVDLCLKLGRSGYRLIYEPRALVYHLESRTEGRFDWERENSNLLSRRWQEVIHADDQSYYREDGIEVTVYRTPEGAMTAIMQDRNDNVFWSQARDLAAAGRPQEAEHYYQKALRFNPFDSRLPALAQELADFLDNHGKSPEAAALRKKISQMP